MKKNSRERWRAKIRIKERDGEQKGSQERDVEQK